MSLRTSCAIVFSLVAASASAGQDFGGLSPQDAEDMIAGYLAMWSTDAQINARTVDQFYAPRVSYYGKSFSRAQVLADKLAYIRQWPRRTYREVPGTLSANCNADKSRCAVTFTMAWRRTSRTHREVSGEARVVFDFVPAEGRRKIARETARML